MVFSIWDSPTDETKSISSNHHPESIIRRFGGEGVGMQCLLYKDWNLDETITQKIIGKLVNSDDTNNNDTNDEKKQIWHISSQVCSRVFRVFYREGTIRTVSKPYQWNN